MEATVTQVPVIIEVIDGKITCSQDPVKVYKDQEVEWVYHPGGLVVDFETLRPFGRQQHRAEDKPFVRSGQYDCEVPEDFKYTISVPVPGVEPLDPVVDADPRKTPRTNSPNG